MTSIYKMFTWCVLATWLLAVGAAKSAAQEAGALPARIIKTQAVQLRTSIANSNRPILVYYAIDTPEPFMQLAVDYEIHQLEKACKHSPEVNWVVILNSAVLAQRGMQVCRSGVYSEVPPPITNIAGWSAYFSGRELLPPRDAQGIPTVLFNTHVGHIDRRKLFADYPLAHPALVYQALEFVLTNIFPIHSYDIFLHLKSHGGPNLLLSALTPDDAAARSVSQEAQWFSLAHILNQSTSIPRVNPGEAGRHELPEALDKQLTRMGLGRAFRPSGGDQIAVPFWMQDLDRGISELGTEMTLEQHFGSSDESLNLVLSSLQLNLGKTFDAEHPNVFVRFLMVESCNSALALHGADSMGSKLSATVEAYYAAPGILWYRNLDWDSIFSMWTHGALTSRHFQELVKDWVGNINSYVP